MTDNDANRDGDEDLNVEMLIKWSPLLNCQIGRFRCENFCPPGLSCIE